MGEVRVETPSHPNKPEWQDANGLPQDVPKQSIALSNLALVAARKRLRQDVPYGGLNTLRIDDDGCILVTDRKADQLVALLMDIKEELKTMNVALLRLR